MAASDDSKMVEIWENVLESESGSYRRRVFLDIFLSNFLIQLKDGKPQNKILALCTNSETGKGISSIIACELFKSIHDICLLSNDEEDVSGLRKYLLDGAGWRYLLALHCLGNKSVASTQELVSILITVYPLSICDSMTSQKIEAKKTNPYIQKREKDSIEEVLKVKDGSRKVSYSTIFPPTRVEFVRSHSNSSTTRFRRQKSTQSSGSLEKAVTSESEQGSDDEKLNKPSTLKIRLNPMDFDYFTSVVRSDDDARLEASNYTPRRRHVREKRKDPEDFMDDRISELMSHKLSGFEFATIVLDILEGLCSIDPVASDINKQSVCIQVMNFILENLCLLQFDVNASKGYSCTEVAELKSLWTRLLLVCLENVQLNEQATTTFIQRGMLPVAIRILEDAIRKMTNPVEGSCEKESQQNDEKIGTDEVADKTHDFVFGLTHGILWFVYHLLSQRNSIDKVSEFLELFGLLTDSQGGRFLDKIIASLVSYPNVSIHIKVSRAKRIIDLLGQMIILLKKSRSDIVHVSSCTNKRHRHCGARTETHHHRDIFGCAYVSSLVGVNSAPSCAIASLFMVFVRLLQLPHSVVTSWTLKVMTGCGTCCCFPPKILIQMLVGVLNERSHKRRSLGLHMLERTMYWEFGAFISTEQTMSCPTCEEMVPGYSLCLESKNGEINESLDLAMPNIEPDLKISPQRVRHLEDVPKNPKSSWSSLQMFIPLLESDDPKVRHMVTSHLLKVAPRCTLAVEHELMFHVFYPVFIKAKQQLNTGNKLAMFTVMSSLSIFSSLLSKGSFAREFLDGQGLSHILDLISIPSLSKLCCSILEITSVIEIWQKECEVGSGPAQPDDLTEVLRTLPSLCLLQDAIQTSSQKLLDYFEANVVVTTLAKEGHHLEVDTDENTESRSNTDSDQTDVIASLESHEGDFLKTESQTDVEEALFDLKALTIGDILKIEKRDSVADSYLTLLLDACVFWRSCANLAIASPQYRKYLSGEDIVSDAYALMKSITSFIAAGTTFAGSQCYMLEMHLFMKLLEATLIVNLASPPDFSTDVFLVDDLDGHRDKNEAGFFKSDNNDTILGMLRHLLLPITRGTEVRQLCDVLIRCSQIQTSNTQVLPPSRTPKLPPLSLKGFTEADITSEEDGEEEGDEVSEDAYITADEGYDADVEVLPLNVVNSANISASQDSKTSRGSNIVHVKLCSLLVDLLATLHQHFYVETKNVDGLTSSVPSESSHLSNLTNCFQRLAVVCRETAFNCSVMASAGLIASILEGFRDVLSSSDKKYSELQRIILELIAMLAEHRMTPPDLTLYLDLFKSDDPPLDILLTPLSGLVDSTLAQPHFILAFPVSKLPAPRIKVPSLDGASALASLMLQHHTKMDWVTAWSVCAVALPINTELGWMLCNGFSLAMWINLEESNLVMQHANVSPSWSSPQSDESTDWKLMSDSWKKWNGQDVADLEESLPSLHMFSVGTPELAIEAWFDFTTASMVLQLVQTHSDTKSVVAQAFVPDFLQYNHWHYLAVNVYVSVQARETVVEVVLILDGDARIPVTLAYYSILSRRASPACLLLGQAIPSNARSAGILCMSNIMMFRSPVMTNENAHHMLGFGPNCISLAECMADHQSPNYTKSFGTKPNVVIWDKILEQDRGVIHSLETKLMLTYSAHNEKIVNFYPQVMGTSNRGLLFPSLANGYRIQSLDQRASQQIPLTLAPYVVAKLDSRQYQGLKSAVSLMGGAPVFLYLFARVLELNASEEIQAKALSILLRLVQGDSELYSQFARQGCNKLLLHALEMKHCLASHHVVKVILDLCCDKSVIVYHPGPGDFSIAYHTNAIIVDTLLLSSMLSSWTAWNSHPRGPDTLAVFFNGIHTLLRDDHPQRAFNAAQLNRVNMVDTLLRFCKERFLVHDEYKIALPLALSVVELVRSLIGAPPKLKHIVAVMDCLLLIHQANNTYVTHSRSSFYYLLTAQPHAAHKPHTSNSSSLVSTETMQVSHGNARNVITTSPDTSRLIIDPADSHHTDKEKSNKESCDEKEVDDEVSEGNMDQNADESWSIESGSDSRTVIVDGFLYLLRDTLRVLPDNMVEQVLGSVVTVEALLVFANHADCVVRSAVLEVLAAHLERSSEEARAKFIAMHGFHQLANQLSLYPASAELVDAAISLFAQHPVTLAEQLDFTNGIQLSPIHKQSCRPMLALLPVAVHDMDVVRGLIGFLLDIFHKFPQGPRMLMDAGLLEALMRTTNAVFHRNQGEFDEFPAAEPDLAIESIQQDIRELLITIVSHHLYAPNGHYVQILCTIVTQLGYLERQERVNCGETSRCVTCIRDTLSVVLEAALNSIQTKVSSLQHEESTLLKSNLSHNLVSSYSYEEKTLMNNNDEGTRMSKPELADRFHIILVKAVEFIINNERPTLSSSIEQAFARHLFGTMVRAVTSMLERRAPRTQWMAVLFAIKNTLRLQTGALLIWILSPSNLTKLRVFAVNLLRGEPLLTDLIRELLRDTTATEQKFTMFLLDLVYNPAVKMQGPDKQSCRELMLQLEDSRLLVATRANPLMRRDEMQVLCSDMEKQARIWHQRNITAALHSVHKHETLVMQTSEAAMASTRTVVALQNAQRKLFMEDMKARFSESVHTRRQWMEVIQRATHERAIWCPRERPASSWQLDATEGPGRVRTRLQRCHLDMDNRYFVADCQSKPGDRMERHPLSFLFEGDRESSTSNALIERLHTNEKIKHMTAARIVTPACEVSGELLIGETVIYFIADDSELGRHSQDITSTVWEFEDIKEVHKRRYQLKEIALEIFLLNGTTYLVAFQSAQDRDTLLLELKDCPLPNQVLVDHLTSAKQAWREGLLTNWDYLTQLNKMAGRSYNDLMQYPVFPWILADYTSVPLDLEDPQVFRNFKKPMAVQDKKNEQHYINNYNYLKQELMEGHHIISLNQEPYHYGSHYSNSGTVLHFLVRLPPFTGMFLTYQDNNFDLPDRTFHSLHTTWRLASSDSTTDVKEMIPEFFHLPEFLNNNEGFNLGVRQNGDRVHDVALPPWCAGNARLFVLVHRQALEAAHVREHLPHWLDLVFGFKQTGKAAVDAVNVFHPATYSGFDVESIKDPLERSAWETMVRTYGQTPRQLLRSPHPMVVQALASHLPKTPMREVMAGVKGLMWGNYVGSPAAPEPVVACKLTYRNYMANLVAFPTGDVFGLPPCASLIVTFNKFNSSITSIRSVCQVSWAHADSAIRIKMKKDQLPSPIINVPALDPVCVCTTTPECNQLWLGHLSGKILVYQFHVDAVKVCLALEPVSVALLGHTAAVVAICLCREFSIAASASSDASVIIWDLNKLCYVRSIHLPSPVTLVTISSTLGDIATVCHKTLSSHTVNAALVGSIATNEEITAVCFSNAPEGISVNVIACGMTSGKIKLWSTWDLTPVRELITESLQSPITCVIFNHSSQLLYAASTQGALVVWESAGSKAAKPLKFLNLAAI